MFEYYIQVDEEAFRTSTIRAPYMHKLQLFVLATRLGYPVIQNLVMRDLIYDCLDQETVKLGGEKWDYDNTEQGSPLRAFIVFHLQLWGTKECYEAIGWSIPAEMWEDLR